jgi:hypothetical protein
LRPSGQHNNKTVLCVDSVLVTQDKGPGESEQGTRAGSSEHGSTKGGCGQFSDYTSHAGLYSVEIILDSRMKETEQTTIHFHQHNNEIISEYSGNVGKVNPMLEGQ